MTFPVPASEERATTCQSLMRTGSSIMPRGVLAWLVSCAPPRCALESSFR